MKVVGRSQFLRIFYRPILWCRKRDATLGIKEFIIFYSQVGKKPVVLRPCVSADEEYRAGRVVFDQVDEGAFGAEDDHAVVGGRH